ncbi:MAG: hypothetical protein ACI9A7_000077 [Cyclobacteriaceae bacterium]|jgi:hypothetical protein
MKKRLVVLLICGVTFCGIISCAEDNEVKIINRVSVSADVESVNEDVGTVMLRVFLDTPTTGENINVIYAASGNVTVISDYEKLIGLITIPADESEAFIELKIVDDNESEIDESFAISLASTNLPEGYVLGESIYIFTIVDND